MDKPLSLIITENNSQKARLMARSLENRGFQVAVCSKNGAELLTLYDSIKADGIIMDVVLSHVDAFGVVSRLNQLNPVNRPLMIVLSDFDNPFFQKAFSKLGVDYYFLKPIEPSVIADRVVQIASWRGFSRSLAVTSSGDMFSDISYALKDMGISPSIKGYYYILDAISICVKNPKSVNRFTENIYSFIARKNNTTVNAVERSIRYAISLVWGNGNLQGNKYDFSFLNCGKRPSNSQFICCIADELRNKYFYVK